MRNIAIASLILLSSCATLPHLVSREQVRGLDDRQVLEGVFRPKRGVAIPYTFEITSKGNGSLVFGSYAIRIYDAHDDGFLFDGFLLDQSQRDINSDGWLDLIVTGAVLMTGEKESDPSSTRPVRAVFLFDPLADSFTNTVSDDAVYVYSVEDAKPNEAMHSDKEYPRHSVADETNRVVKMRVTPIRFEPQDVPREVFIGTRTNAIRTVAELKARVTGLPRGTTLHWYSSCFHYRFVPVGTNRIDRKRFTRICSEAGVTFSYSCGF
jgi:hypothetical protein